MPVNLKKLAFRAFRQFETKNHELNYLFWECTARCNLRCLHCGSDCRTESVLPDMPSADFLRALDTIADPSAGFIVVFTGGEPLLRSDIEYCGREIRKRGMRWSLVSNGMLYDRDRHNSLLNAGMGALTISLDGLEENHNWLRDSGKGFEKTIEAVSIAANSSRLNFDVVTCVHQRNIDELPALKDLLVKMGVRSWRLFTITPIGRARENKELLLSSSQFKTLMEFIVRARKENMIGVSFSCEGYTGRYELSVRDSFFFCRAGINIGSILIDGSVSACPNIDRSMVQGNIYRDNFYDVWQNRFSQFRNREWARTGLCMNCSDFRDCLGNGLHNRSGAEMNLLTCHRQMAEEQDNKTTPDNLAYRQSR